MCRLVGWVSESPRTLAEVLGEDGVTQLEALSRQHADGWGLAWWDADELHVRTSHLPAHLCPAFLPVTRDVRSDAVLLHLRWATPGLAVRPANTHPFVVGDWAFGHNGAVRPADGLLPLLTPQEREGLRGDTDSERLLHVLLARIRDEGLDEGLRRTVDDASRDLTPSSLNSLLLGREELTAVCCHGTPSECDPDGPPEDQPGYFDLRWRRDEGVVVIASEPLGSAPWRSLPNGTALIASRGGSACRTVDVGTFGAAALDRERDRRSAGAELRAAGAAELRAAELPAAEMRAKSADPMLGR